jgi:sulfiredoxin
MLKTVLVKIEEIYIPADRRKEIDLKKVEVIAEEIMEGLEEQPIQVRRGKGRYVLVSGVVSLEARKALGEETVHVVIVGARLH